MKFKNEKIKNQISVSVSNDFNLQNIWKSVYECVKYLWKNLLNTILNSALLPISTVKMSLGICKTTADNLLIPASLSATSLLVNSSLKMQEFILFPMDFLFTPTIEYNPAMFSTSLRLFPWWHFRLPCSAPRLIWPRSSAHLTPSSKDLDYWKKGIFVSFKEFNYTQSKKKNFV